MKFDLALPLPVHRAVFTVLSDLNPSLLTDFACIELIQSRCKIMVCDKIVRGQFHDDADSE